VVAGGLAFVAGQIALEDGRALHPGRVGDDVSVEEAREATRRCTLQALAALKHELGTLDRLQRIVQVSVFVVSDPNFTDLPQVANAASELFAEVLGDAGRHARATVGVAVLPLGVPVEVAVVAEVGE
jgi:enamine deaminase RidA (YjgF/YER057c/UK114 family)